MKRFQALLWAVVLLSAPANAAPPTGYSPNVTVSNPTRIDWTFTAANRSVEKPGEDFIENNYDSTKQSYELFVPARKDTKKPLPAILFIAANDASSWSSFETPCTQLGFVYIGVHNAGNSVKVPKRCRIALDALDDVRRQLPLDPDRTYVSGVSGGGRMACMIGFSHPEYFGGVMPFVAGGDLRSESWLRHRAIDRLSAALITGQNDFNRGEVERLRGPMWKEIGIRTRVWMVPNMGHTNPPSSTITEAIKWLDEGRAKRAELAKKYPTTRVSPKEALSRTDLAKALLEEGKEKLKSKETLFAGLMLLKGVFERWPDLPAGEQAKTILLSYDGKTEKPWEQDDIAEQRKYMVAEARALTGYTLLGVPPKSPYAKNRPDMAKSAIQQWQRIITVLPDSDAAKEGKKQIAELEKIVGK